MRRAFLRVALLAAGLALVLGPGPSPSQTPVDEPAVRGLLATNLADALVNPAKGEDTEFFIRSGGVPNIFFLVDTSGSMERMPPDGPATYGGVSPTMPPGVFLGSPTGSTAQAAAFASRHVVGCADPVADPIGAANPLFAGNDVVKHIQGRKFFPPCGQAHDSGLVGDAYRGHPGTLGGADYAWQASICPYYTSSNSQTVWPANRGGYDPDYYNEAPNDTQVPNTLWVDDLVYHDSILQGDNYSRQSSLAFSHNFGNGWDAGTTSPTAFPYRSATNTFGTIDQFCDEQGTTPLANGQIPAAVCKACMRKAGWYYDGVLLESDMDGTGVLKRYPSIWYTGNYLNFFPPKFVIVRKVVKDVIATQSKVRMALARFGSGGMSWLKEFNPTCAHPDSSFDSNRGTYVNLMNGLRFSGGTPLSTSLFDVGRYYHSPDLPWFGSSWERTGSTWESSSNSNDFAICYSCQVSSVILLTDGLPSQDDGNGLPSRTASLADSLSGKYAGDRSTGILGVSTADCPECGAFTLTDDYKNNTARVAWYLHNYDLRDDREATKDCRTNGGRQTLDVYTVGYATRQLPDANTVLANAAGVGGGLFVAAENPQILKEGILSVLEEINTRSTSFSVATVSTLQTTAGSSVIVPRFDPQKGAFWDGHLYRYEMYSEFVNECDPTRTTNPPNCCSPNGPGDYDCDGKCLSVFLQDSGDPPSHDARFIQEGGDGFFYRNTPDTASCTQAPMCVAKGRACGTPSNVPARPWWDAGAELDKRAWRDRHVFTVVDRNASGARDGRIDRDDVPIRLDTSSDLSARAILPYLANRDNAVCSLVAARIETAGDPVTAEVVRTNEVECAQTVVRWVLGADVFNEAERKPTDSPPWPPPRPDPGSPATVGDPNTVPPIPPNLPDQERLPDRPNKLGDVFHSSPVVVEPPCSRTGILARLGFVNQCLQALWRAPSGADFSADDAEYDAFAAAYRTRRKVILVGSNAGLLHAFNGGTWHAGEDDPYTDGLDESRPPFNGHYDRSEPLDSAGIWAQELWAFLPPDMIPKLKLVFRGEHQLLVDGTAMVRDVWVDGTENGADRSGTPPDDLKQAREFHTVAVVGERRGGTHYFALDVTDATKAPSETGFQLPRFLWMYPQPTDASSLLQGETYTDFLPVPPPIGPVRIRADASSGGTHPDTPRKVFDGVEIPFHERWVAFLSGGFDPQYVRGRGVHMVDAWTGHEYFDFSYARKDPADPDDPRQHLRYPVPATMGMVMWGPGSRRESGLGYANQGFFDTATFGDSGGQLWTLRFHLPGELDGPLESGGKVRNWFGARAFQMGGAIEPSLGWAHPFFYITANTALPESYIYRAYLGTGDRFNLLDSGGGICGPDNIRACAMRGCTVDVDLPSNYALTPELARQSGSQAEVAKGALTTGFASAASASGSVVEVRARIAVSRCPSPASAQDLTAFTKDVTVSCSADAQGRWGCVLPGAQYGDTLNLANDANAPVTRNWYFSVRIFDDAPQVRIPFKTLAEAKAYDAARLWIRDTGTAITQSTYAGGDFTILAASTANPTVPQDPTTSAGWAIYFDHGPTAVADGNSYNVNALDERVSSVSGLGGGLITWNTTQTTSGEVTSTNGNCFPSKCTAVDRRVAYHYGAHPLTGGSMLRDETGALVRAIVGNTLVPSQGDQPTVFVNQKGQVLIGHTVVNPEKGAGSLAATDPTDAVKDLGWIEIPEQVHACRHAASPPEEGVCR